MEPLGRHVWLEECWSIAAPDTEYSLDIQNKFALPNRLESM
jgi:hypothetical protein